MHKHITHLIVGVVFPKQKKIFSCLTRAVQGWRARPTAQTVRATLTLVVTQLSVSLSLSHGK